MEKLMDTIETADSRIRAGNINGMRLLAFLAYVCTQELEKWMTSCPEFVADVAQEYKAWPILASTKVSMVTDKAKRLKVLRLGSKEPLIGLGTPPTEGAEE